MDDEHIKSKPGSKDLRSREEGALSRLKAVSSEPKQASASGCWVSIGYVSQRINDGKLWTRQCDGDFVFHAPLEWNVGRWSLGRSGSLPFSPATSCSRDTKSHSTRT